MKFIKLISILATTLFMLAWLSASSAYAQTIGSIQHIHNVKVFGDKILLGTHHGLYQYYSSNSIKMIGSEKLDLMALTVNKNSLYASGHPEPGSKVKNPLGLIRSTDGGKTWKVLSLQGNVDFHLLEVNENRIYGVDAQSSKLLHSSNGGKTWKDLGKTDFEDFAIFNAKKNEVYAIEAGSLYRTIDGFKSVTKVKTVKKVSSVEILASKIFIVSDNKIFSSKDLGKKWSLVYSFKEKILDLSLSYDLMVAISANNLYVSSDGGREFT